MSGKYRFKRLSEREYEEWNRFVDTSPQGCIFCKSWWLDAVSPGRYSIFAVFKKDSLIGGIPIVQKTGMKRGRYGMPPLTQTLGVLLPPSERSYPERISEEKKIIECAVDALGEPDYFSQNFHYNFENWLPFMWRGYKQTTRYTYVLEDIKDEERLWGGLAKNIRSDISKARRLGLQIGINNLAQRDFWDIYVQTFARQNMAAPINFNFFCRLDDQLGKFGKRKMLFVFDEDRKIHAVLYFVIDNGYVYYLLGGADPTLRSSGATAFGLFEGIRLVSREADFFDFEGSVVKNIETFFRAFGGYQKPYFQISRHVTKTHKFIKWLKGFICR